MMKGAILSTVVCLLLGASLSAQGQPAKPIKPRATPAPLPVTATVTDEKGQATVVEGLKAHYVYNPNGQRPEPIIRDIGVLSLLLTQREGRIEIDDRIEIPFGAMQRLAFRGPVHELEVVRKDGGVVVIDQARGVDRTVDVGWILLERNAAGDVVKRLGLYKYEPGMLVEDGKILDAAIMRQLRLSGFIGLARTSSGKVGEYFISQYEARVIEFK